MRIRNETPADIAAISRIQYLAFRNHPQHAPGAEPTEHEIVERLRVASALSLSLVAEDGTVMVGHIALSSAAVGAKSEGWFLLGPVGVLPSFQRQGVGSALIREALQRMRSQGAAGIVLVGDPAFYSRFGFTQPDRLTYAGVPARYVLAVAFGGSAPAGEITAHPAFG